MIAAFLKRRWVLLSCAVVLVACSGVKFQIVQKHFMIGIARGDFFKAYGSDVPKGADMQSGFAVKLTKVQFGERPRFVTSSSLAGVKIPLWLLLSGILGWIVLGELRRKEKKIARKRRERTAQTAMDVARRKRYLVSNALPI